MGFLFGAKRSAQNVALFDIGSGSVAGALTRVSENEPPALYFTARLPVERRGEESVTSAMERSLKALADLMVAEGAPVLRRETGHAGIEDVVASVSAPWQETHITVDTIQESKPFTFTENLLNERIKAAASLKEGCVSTGHSVIATLLNGYEISQPFGKRAKRADLVIVSSSITAEAEAVVKNTIRRAFHAHDIDITAFGEVAYTAFRDLFPHEKDFIVVDVAGEGTDLLFVKQGLLLDVASAKCGVNALLAGVRQAARGSVTPLNDDNVIDSDRNNRFAGAVSTAEEEWLEHIRTSLKSFASRHPLPRTLFLLSDAHAREFLVRRLGAESIRSLWLSDEPLTVIPVKPQHFAPFIKTRGAAEGDIFLALLALFRNRGKNVRRKVEQSADEAVIPTKNEPA